MRTPASAPRPAPSDPAAPRARLQDALPLKPRRRHVPPHAAASPPTAHSLRWRRTAHWRCAAAAAAAAVADLATAAVADLAAGAVAGLAAAAAYAAAVVPAAGERASAAGRPWRAPAPPVRPLPRAVPAQTAQLHRARPRPPRLCRSLAGRGPASPPPPPQPWARLPSAPPPKERPALAVVQHAPRAPGRSVCPQHALCWASAQRVPPDEALWRALQPRPPAAAAQTAPAIGGRQRGPS
eukprot:37504-Chlamydomonas_euryale.AAC.5